ncbi:protein starmaker [Betta splendens]|uniref:Protein starmaker n=1 Tax=Betta splendens TaxID=158456 RepID=A0A6P7NX79_BETSP|nr:protein starmaker [Betta splendens]XP_055368659.1 protein starmaker [Betta splendens]XP_055368660.1 protein starmaker [Betta splendens]
MLGRCVLLGCLACLLMTAAADADGRVFVLELRNSSGLQGFRDAERACASQHARVASAEELRHSVAECFFSSCARGWLHGGAVGTTVCDTVGGAPKAVDVRTQNATDDSANLDAFCIKDDDEPCGDPPSFPNARLQGRTGFAVGDELLYACAPGFAMPRGQSTFSLLCDSCGEWYGLVQMCVRDGSEVHVDYEDRFPDSHEDTEGKSEEQHGEQEVRGEVVDLEGATEGKVKDVQDVTGRPTWQQESREEPEATEAPISLLSQKHMFWFPSEAFQEEGLPVSTNQNTQRSSGAQSEESKEHESQERRQHPVGGDDHGDGRDRYEDHDADDQDDHDSRQDEDDHDEHYVPARDDLTSREHDDQDDDKHESHEDHDDITDHHDEDDDDDDRTHVDHVSEEHLDRDDHDHDVDESDTDHDHHEHDDHDNHDDHDSYDDLDSHEYDDDGHRRVIFSIGADRSRNVTQKKAGAKATTDETWLDGYPVVPEETGGDDSAMRGLRPELRQRGSALRSTDRPNEVELRKPDPFPRESEPPTTESELDGAAEDMWGSFIPTAPPSPYQLQPSDPHALDYDAQEAPTDSWQPDPTEHPFFSHDPAPPAHDADDVLAGGVMEEHTMHNLPGEAGERGEMGGERGGSVCAGDACPPRAPGRGPKVAAIIVAVLAVATAILAGAWCYRRQQQKSSVYEMNGKSPSQSGRGQQMEMQQKV